MVLQVVDTPQVKVTSANSSPTEDQLAEAEQLKSDGMDIKSVVTFEFLSFFFFKLCTQLNVAFKALQNSEKKELKCGKCREIGLVIDDGLLMCGIKVLRFGKSNYLMMMMIKNKMYVIQVMTK